MIFPSSTRPLRFGISLGGNSSSNNGPVHGSGSPHDHNHNMQLKSDNNNQHQQQNNAPPPPPAKNHRPNYLPVPVTIPVNVQVDYDSDESDGPILYRDDEDENMSDEGNFEASYFFYWLHSTVFMVLMCCSATGIPDSSQRQFSLEVGYEA